MSPRMRTQGIVLLNTRINFYNGNPPGIEHMLGGYDYWRGSHEDWHVVKHVPKQRTWAMSTHPAATKHHVIRYQLVATHKRGEVVKITVWECAGRCKSELRVGKRPNPIRERCWGCSRMP